MSDYPMLISNKLHSFRNFEKQKNENYGTIYNGIFNLFVERLRLLLALL